VVQQDDPAQGKRLKYASAHDIRRGCAQRLINAGISAETLKLVMRHKDFSTTERYYGATRQAQSAASELFSKLDDERKNSELMGGD
jgi:integrase